MRTILMIISFSFIGILADAGTQPSVALVLWNLSKNENQIMTREFYYQSKLLKFNPVIVDSKNNQEIQTKEIQKLIKDKVNAVIMQPVDEKASQNIVRDLKTAKIPLINILVYIEDANVDALVKPDYFETGRQMVRNAAEAINNRGNLIHLGGPQTEQISNQIQNGIVDELKKNPDLKMVLDAKIITWKAEEAKKAVEKFILNNKQKIDAVLADDWNMLYGGLEALKKNKNVFISLGNLENKTVQFLDRGRQTQIIRNYSRIIEVSAQIAIDLAHKSSSELTTENTQNGKFQIPTATIPVLVSNNKIIKHQLVRSGFGNPR